MAGLYMGRSMMGYPPQTGIPQPGHETPQPAAAAAPIAPPNQLQSVATRASGPTKGYDPSYLQNLATSIGGLFSGNTQGGVQNINPLGNLSEISPSSGIGGNAPTQGLPLTWLQQALNGGGFSSPAASTPVTTVKPKAPIVKPVSGPINGAPQTALNA